MRWYCNACELDVDEEEIPSGKFDKFGNIIYEEYTCNKCGYKDSLYHNIICVDHLSLEDMKQED